MDDVITGPTLAEVMDRRMLSMDETLNWAPDIADSLEELHRQGRCHGAVTAAAVRIDGHRAVLMPGREGFNAAKQAGDMAQFAALLKTMLKRADVKTDAERGHWRVLYEIAMTKAHAFEETRMNVAAALRPVRPQQRAGAAEPEPLGREEDDCRARGHVSMVTREELQEPPVRRVRARVVHVWAALSTAAGLAVTGCMIFLKFVR